MKPIHRRRHLSLLLVITAACAAGPPQQPAPTQRPDSARSGAVDGGRTLAELFEGKFSGVTVTQVPGGVKLRIRNAQNFDGSGVDPLYVIDDVPIQPPDGVLSINPNDVLKIEILKDDASTLVWGPRAANGVVKITTKRK